MNYLFKYKIKALVLLLFLASSLFFVFHKQFQTGFTFVIGSRFDGLIESSILQHWYNFFVGKSVWNNVGYFYPYTDTLGYNDGYFIYGVIFSLFRMAGGDIFLSSELVNLILKIIGFLSFFFLAHRTLKLSFFISVTGATMFTLSNALTMQMHHAQLLSIAFAPLMTIFICNYFHAIIQKQIKKAIVNGSLAALLLSAWLITTYYMAWFYILFFVLFAICLLPSFIFNFSILKNSLRAINLTTIFVPLIILAIGLIPFLDVYLPKAKETGGQDLYSVAYYVPKLGNLLDPGKDNFLFGELSGKIFSEFFPSVQRVGELNVGFPWFCMGLLLLTFVVILFKRSIGLEDHLIKALVFTIILSFILMVKYDDFFLWEYVWRYMPGAKGMRVTSRYALFLIFPVCLLSVLFLSGKIIKLPKEFVFCLGAMLILEQANFASSANLNRESQQDFVKSIPIPPENCKLFYVVGQRENEFDINSQNGDLSLYPHNVDAMLISEVYALRTINGFSTFNPKTWDFNQAPLNTYRARVKNYLFNHGLMTDICELDLFNKKWIALKNLQDVGLSHRIAGKLKITLSSKPVFDIKNKTWSFDVLLSNFSDSDLGKGTYNQFSVGVRLYNNNHKMLDQDYLRADMPFLKANGGSKAVTITLPGNFDDKNAIDVILVEEGVSWFDLEGMRPVFLTFK